MKTIEKGMYVRTKWGRIGKILSIDASLDVTDIDNPKTEMSIMVDTHYYFEDEYDSYSLDEIVGEPSFDVRDLIKAGDFINKGMVEYISNDRKTICIENVEGFINDFKNYDIYEVLTKEQYEMICYEVKHDKTN